ncbi:MAG: glycosyltransferase family 4 protein [Desulfobacula sp.]|nr:glycosyltransferase family 4 protein [Desulfobacula sp.]
MKTSIKKKLKILFISSDTFKPFRPDVKVLFGIKLIERGHQIDWILQSGKPCIKSKMVHWHGNRVFVGRFKKAQLMIHRLTNHLFAFLNELKIFKLTGKNHYDFILVKDKYLVAVLAIFAAIIFKTKFIFWLSYPFPEAKLYKVRTRVAPYPLIYTLRGVISSFFQYRIIMKQAKHVFVQSEQMKKDIAEQGISPNKMTSIPMGVQLEKIGQSILSNNTSKKEKRILYLGTMAKERHLEFLLKVHKKLLITVPETKLYMVGDDDDPQILPFLKKTARELCIHDSVIFTGFIPRKEAWELIKDAQVCLSPFYPTFILNSTSPTKLIEYMALAKPVVANNHPEQKLVISESKAGICTPWDEDAFAKAIQELLNNPDLAHQMGKAGRIWVQKHRSYDTLAEQVITTLQSFNE